MVGGGPRKQENVESEALHYLEGIERHLIGDRLEFVHVGLGLD